MRGLLDGVHRSAEGASLTERAEHPRRTILVTGAAGFIGSALCRRFVSAGHRVVGYDDLSRGRREHLPQGVTLVEGDIRDRARFARTLADVTPDCVVHLAAMHFIPDCIARPGDTLDVNVEGTRSVLEGCRGRSVRSFVFTSTAGVYAPSDGACVEDASPLGPLEVYGESKVAAELLVRAFQEETGTTTAIARLFNAVGRRETNAHVIPHIFESLRTSDTLQLGNLAPRRDYIDTRDVADALLALSACPPGLHVLNVGTGVTSSVSDVVEWLRRILGRPIVAVQDPARVRATERMVLLADIAKIRRATGWAPRITLEQSLEDLAQAYGLKTA